MMAAPNISSACYPPARFSQSGHEPKSSSFNNCAWMLQNLRTQTKVVWLHNKLGYNDFVQWDRTSLKSSSFKNCACPPQILVTTIFFYYPSFSFPPLLHSLFLPLPVCSNASLPHFLPSLQILAAKISGSPCSSLCPPHSTTSSCRGSGCARGGR